LEKDGGKITHIIERDAAIYKADGIDVEDAKQYLIEHGSFKGYEGCDEIEVKDPLKFMEREVDYLIPAATEKSIHKGNADKL
jgi:glutamate dehydrogenase/leucine dehydrogenase